MISLELDKAHIFSPGEILHIKIISFITQSPGRWKIKAQDITPLPGSEPDGYACHGCGIIVQAKDDGSLPDDWEQKKFKARSYFLCSDCLECFQYCRDCGCSEEDSCDEGCYWIEEDLCSACVASGRDLK